MKILKNKHEVGEIDYKENSKELFISSQDSKLLRIAEIIVLQNSKRNPSNFKIEVSKTENSVMFSNLNSFDYLGLTQDLAKLSEYILDTPGLNSLGS